MRAVVVALFVSLCVWAATAQSCEPGATVNTCGYGFCDPDRRICVCYEGYMITNRTSCADCAEGYTKRPDGTCVRSLETNPCSGKDCGNGYCQIVTESSGEAATKCFCYTGYTNEGLPNTTCSVCAPGYVKDNNNRCVLSNVNPCGTSNDPCTSKPNQVCVFGSNGAYCICQEGFVRDNIGACVPRNTTAGCPDPSPCNNGVCVNSTSAPLGFFCQCNRGWVHSFISNADGTQSVRFCSACAPDYIMNRVYNDVTGQYDITCQPASPCTNVNCGPYGYCEVISGAGAPTAVCRCRPNFANANQEPTSPCTACATGYTNPVDTTIAPPCSLCATGYTASGSYCFPSGQEPTCPVACGPFGTCKMLETGAYTCVCNAGYMHDPVDPQRRPCSVCRDGVSDPANGCTPPAPGNFTQCMEACRAKDPNSICVAASTNAAGFLGFRCQCLPRYVPDERGLCTRCAPGYYSSNSGACVESRCPNGCNLGVCVADYSTSVPTFSCKCPPGYSGPNCLTYTPPTSPCNGQCGPNEICVIARTAVPNTIDPTIFETVEVQRCICKRNFVDDIRRDGAIVKCGKCADGWAGANCLIPALPDQSPCEHIVCPEPSTCHVLARNATSTEFVTRCLCRDGIPFNPTTRCGLASDVPNANTCPAVCPANAECVRSDLTATGTRCICKAGFRPSTTPDGVPICIPERPPAECPIPCAADQVCVSGLDFSSSAVTQTPKCACRSQNAYLNESGVCVCRPGFFGPGCSRVANPCNTFADRCPPRSECVPVESSADQSLTYKCVCRGSLSGEDCSVDLCAGKSCPDGTRCNKNGQCVCPINQVLDANNRCVDRPRNPPSDVVNSDCSDATSRTCIVPPTTRDINKTRDAADDKEIVLHRPGGNNDEKIDDFGVNFRANGGAVFSVCVRRILGLKRQNSAEDIQVAIRVCLRLAAIEIREVPEGGNVNDDGSSVRNITIGSNDANGADTRTEIEESDISTPGVRTLKYVIRTLDGLVRLECFVANTSRAVEDTVTTPSNIHCNLYFAVPAVYFSSARSKVCFRLIADRGTDTTGFNDGVFTIKTDTDTSRISFYPVREGKPLATGADLSFENFAWVGTARVGVTYTAVMQNGGFIVRGCFNTFNPDGLKLDPALGSSTGYDAFEQTAAPSGGNNGAPQNSGLSSSASAIAFSALLAFAIIALSLLF